MGPTPRHSASMGIGAYRLWPYLSYDLYPLATNPRNIRYHTPLYEGGRAQRTPSYALIGVYVAGDCYREFPRMLISGNSANRGDHIFRSLPVMAIVSVDSLSGEGPLRGTGSRARR